MQTVDEINAKDTNQNSKGLGRGLDSLIPTGFDVDERTTTPTGEISTSLIDPNPLQPRREFEEEALVDLANSIRKYGIIQPLLVTKKGDRYELVAGERRLRAAKVAGLSMVPVIERTMEEQEKLEVAIIENLQRENLNPIELGLSYKRLMSEFSLSQEEVAERVGKARSTVANTMRLLTLPLEIKEALAAGKISEGHARALLNIKDPQKQMELFKKILEGGLNVRDLEDKAARVKNLKADKDPNILAAEKRLGEVMGTKVNIKRSGARGKIEIEYYSFEDLERIYTKIVGH